MMNYQSINKLTVSKEAADAVKEVIDFFDKEIFDDWDSVDVMRVLYAIANRNESVEVHPLGDYTRPTTVEIEIED